MSELTGYSFIGHSRGSGNQVCGHAVCAADGQRLEPPYHSASPEETSRALALAAEAFPAYAALPGARRGAFLREIAAQLEAEAEALAARGPLETGLPEARIRGELARTTGQLRMFAALVEDGSWVDARIERAQPERQPLPKPDLRSMWTPLGPVAVFCAGNFPLAFSVAGGDTASALAAGCPVVVIAHHAHPGVAEIAARAVLAAARACDMPEGVFSLLFGGGRSVGTAVVRHPAIAAVGFTGSRAGGMALMETAAARPKPIPVYAEMSSVNPVVILPDALADSARAEALAEGFFSSLTLGCGQFCTNPGLLFLPDQGADRFLTVLAQRIHEAAPGLMLTAGIAQSYRSHRDAITAHPAVTCLASADTAETGQTGSARLLEVSARDFTGDPALQQEMFGPACLVVRGSEAEILTALASLEGQLTASLHGSPEEIAARPALVQSLRNLCGRLVFNGFPTGVEVCSSMVHGGPFPSTSDGRSSSVGTLAIHRFCRQACWQNAPDAVLPPELRDDNPTNIRRSE